MGQEPEQHRPPDPSLPDHRERMDSGVLDPCSPREKTPCPSCIASDSALPVRGPSSLPAVCTLLLLAVILVFGQTVRHEFTSLDDADYVYENWHVRGGLTGEGIAWAFTQSHRSNWHPLTWLSLMTDAHLLTPKKGPLDRARLAAGMHLVNVAMHAANAMLLFLVLRGLTASVWRSALVAAVFAVHPLRVESVAWITERKDVLSGLFGLLAIGAYAWYARCPGVVRYLTVTAALTLGLMAKSILVTWPLVFLLLDYWPLRRQPSVRLVLEKVPLLLLGAASATATFLAHRSGGSVISLTSAPISERIARAAVVYVAYLGKSLWPVNLAATYPVAPMESCRPALGAGALLLLLTAGTLWGAWRGQRWLAVGWFWYLGTLVPTIGLVQVGVQVMADRFLYLPQIGICLSMVWGAAQLAGLWRCRRWPLAGASALVVAGLIVCAWQQTRYWSDNETLWTHTLACTSQNRVAHYCLGAALAHRGRVNEAIDQYKKALKIMPDYVEPRYTLGLALASRGQVDEAIAQFRQALDSKPDYAEAHYNLGLALAGRGQADEAIAQYRKALDSKPDYAEAHNNLGLALADHGELDEAIAHYRKALDIKPDLAEAHNNLGLVLANRGQLDEAIVHYRKTLEIKPDCAQACTSLGNALADRGQVDEAIAQYRKALDIEPDYVEAHNNLGLTLAGRGQVDEAITCFRKALEIKPDDALAHYNLGLALSDRGRVDDAVAHFRKALKIKPDYVEAHINLGLALAGRGQANEAIACFHKALEIKPDDASAHYNLGLALAGRGLRDEAIAHYRKALDLARQQHNQTLAESIQAKLRLDKTR